MEDPTKMNVVPTVTGNPKYDTALGYFAVHVGMILAASCVAWMDAHGFDTKALAKDGIDLTVLISGTIVGIILSVAAWVWGQYRTKWSQKAIVDNTVHAALTGEVPVAIISKATIAQAQAVEASPTASVK